MARKMALRKTRFEILDCVWSRTSEFRVPGSGRQDIPQSDTMTVEATMFIHKGQGEEMERTRVVHKKKERRTEGNLDNRKTKGVACENSEGRRGCTVNDDYTADYGQNVRPLRMGEAEKRW